MGLLNAVRRLSAAARTPVETRIELTRQLYAGTPTNLAVAAAVIVCCMGIGVHLRDPVFFWLAAANTLSAAPRAALYLAFQPRRDRAFDLAEAKRWTLAYGWLSIAFALAFGAVIYWGIPRADTASVFVIADLMVLYSAQSARGSTQPWIALTNGFIITVAVIAGVVVGHPSQFWLMGAFLSLFYVAFVGSVLVYQKSLVQRLDAQRDVEYLARHDSLTGLYNRAHFTTLLGEAVDRARAEERFLAVHFIDLDRFKPVNDSFGHERGDALLRAVAERLTAVCDGVGITSRIGGDEFIVLQKHVEDDLAACRFGEMLCEALGEVGAPLGVSASVGMAMFPQDGEGADDLVRAADIALYDAKAAGRSVFRCFDLASAERMREHQALVHDIRCAVEAGELHLVYQPQGQTRSGAIEGFEALARWTHPRLGAIGPDRFVPIAEEAGAIGALGAWVLDTACREAAGWAAPLAIAVNLSPSQILSGGLPELVADVLARTGLEASRLELEITEGIFIKDTQQTLEALNSLKAMGVRIAMDDFGTGYSSLSYLQAFPFDRIKIDRSFVSNLEDSPHSRAIVKVVTSLGRALGIPVLAEGVETESQRALLLSEGCAEFQGYLLGRPARIETFAAITRPGEDARLIA